MSGRSLRRDRAGSARPIVFDPDSSPGGQTMKWRQVTPRSMVILYYGCFALLWGGIAIAEIAAGGLVTAHGGSAGHSEGIRVVALALHAAAVVLLAWKAARWLFAHGPVAVAFCGLPLFPLLQSLWFAAAFLYVIAVLYVWLASRRDSLGRLQATRHSARSEPL
jgi:hypothetical protein